MKLDEKVKALASVHNVEVREKEVDGLSYVRVKTPAGFLFNYSETDHYEGAFRTGNAREEYLVWEIALKHLEYGLVEGEMPHNR